MAPESQFAGAPEDLRTAIDLQIEALQPDLRRIVHTLHANPETVFQEHQSARLITDILSEYGIAAPLGAHGVDTAVRAEIRGNGDGPTIAVLSEYDALPGIGHACGHNVIAATGVGAFLALAGIKDRLNGTVVFLGTPAEEGHSGKEILARNGAFEDVDAAIMVHPYGYDLADQGTALHTTDFAVAAASGDAVQGAYDGAAGLGTLMARMLTFVVPLARLGGHPERLFLPGPAPRPRERCLPARVTLCGPAAQRPRVPSAPRSVPAE